MAVWASLVPLGSLSFTCQCSSEIPENSHRSLCSGKILNTFFNNHNYWGYALEKKKKKVKKQKKKKKISKAEKSENKITAWEGCWFVMLPQNRSIHALKWTPMCASFSAEVSAKLKCIFFCHILLSWISSLSPTACDHIGNTFRVLVLIACRASSQLTNTCCSTVIEAGLHH